MQIAQYLCSPLFLVHSDLEHKDQFSFSPRRLFKDVKRGGRKNKTRFGGKPSSETGPGEVERNVTETSGNLEKHVLPRDAGHLPEVLDQLPLLYAHISEVYLLFRKT